MAFREYIAGFLNGLRTPGGPRIHHGDLATAADLSRTTLYNWMSGLPATEDKIEKLALGMKKLIEQHQPEQISFYEDIAATAARLKEVLAESSDPSALTYYFFEHLPVCNLPVTLPPGPGTAPDGDWGFLGSILTSYLKVGGYEPIGQPCNVSNFEGFGGNDVLVGLFPMPQRMDEWDFVRTPIQIPLNAVVLWRDLVAFVDRVLPLRHRRGRFGSREDYYAGLCSALWQPFTPTEAPRPVLVNDLRPVTAHDEAGWTYLKSVHGFGEDLLKAFWTRKDGKDRYDPEAFREQLLLASEQFVKELGAEHPRLGELRLPILVADELTCLSVINLFGADPTYEPILLSDPRQDAADPDLVVRPRYAPSLAVRRDLTRDSPTPSPNFSRLQESFAEFIWSYADLIAQEFVHLYGALVTRFGGLEPLRGVAPLYFFRWLSLHIQDEEIRSGLVTRPEATSLETPSDLQPWRDVLRNVRRRILKDPELRARAEAALLLLPQTEKQDG